MKGYLLMGGMVFGLTVAGTLLLNHFFPATENLPVVTMILQTPCDLHQAPCIASDARGRSIRFSINPTSIPLMEDLTVQAETNNLPDISSLRLTVEGVEMFMGYQYANLQVVEGKPQQFSGKLMLPICSLQTMQWLAILEALTPTAKLQVKIPFETVSKTALKPFNQQLLEK